MREKSQIIEVINYLRKYKKITSLDAIKLFSATRLSSIIYRLRDKGFEIETETAFTRNRYGNSTKYAVYKLIKDVEEL